MNDLDEVMDPLDRMLYFMGLAMVGVFLLLSTKAWDWNWASFREGSLMAWWFRVIPKIVGWICIVFGTVGGLLAIRILLTGE